MRSSTSAPIGVVSKLMDMHATLGTWIIPRNVPADSRGGTLRRLLKGDGAGDLGVTAEDSDYKRRASPCQLNCSEQCQTE